VGQPLTTSPDARERAQGAGVSEIAGLPERFRSPVSCRTIVLQVEQKEKHGRTNELSETPKRLDISHQIGPKMARLDYSARFLAKSVTTR